MARPKSEHPTPAELEVLKIIWEQGPQTVRDVLEALPPREDDGGRAYTSVMSLMNVMADKGLLERRPKGRAFEYEATEKPDKTLGRMVTDLLGRAFGNSPSALVTHLLANNTPSAEELDAIRQTIESYDDQSAETSDRRKKRGSK